MSIAIVNCRAQLGLHAPLVHVEVSIDIGLPGFNIVGLPATVVKESKDRVRAAIVNSDLEFPTGRITVNLSPADFPKRGGRFDLPIALGILIASGQLKLDAQKGIDLARLEFFGELGLTGLLKSVPGLFLPAACAARDGREIMVPLANAEEVRTLLSGSTASAVIRAGNHLLQVCAYLDGSTELAPLLPPAPDTRVRALTNTLDLSDVRGQVQAKRALAVAAAGGHSLLMRGPPGSGKSMLAMRLPGLLPPMTDAESIEAAAIASVSGVGVEATQFGRRPVRTPHHSTSCVALVGGGPYARPGEISLAHNGVLFLDELLEFDRRALESLREPLESGVVSIARASYHTRYPAQFQLIAAMNPCPCGRFGDLSGECHCSPPQIAQYLAKVSAPLLERFDIHLVIPRVDLVDFEVAKLPRATSSDIRSQVSDARSVQLKRQGCANSHLTDAQTENFCMPSGEGKKLLDQAVQVFGLSARSRQRALRLARTIADLAEEEGVSERHIAEAMSYRLFDRKTPKPQTSS